MKPTKEINHVERVRGILDQNAFSFDRCPAMDSALGERVRQRLHTVGPTAMLFYDEPLHIVRGEGCWLFDDRGQRYLDFYNNVQSLGHGHPRVVEAVARQMATLNVHTRYLHDDLHRYGNRLLATLPPSLDRLVLTCTGSESNDLALRLARHWTGRRGVIVTEAAYHGNTAAVNEVSPSSYKEGTPPDHVYTIPLASIESQADPGRWFADQVRAGLSALEARGHGCAALLVDSIFSSDGVYADPAGFLKAAVEHIQSSGGLFIADEVQPGFGRTGEQMWGFARHQVVPDVVTLGKPMGNGFPIAGLAARENLLAKLALHAGYFNTFGGSTAAVAAGLAVLDVLEQEQLLDNARRMGDDIRRKLLQRMDYHEEIGSVRGVGLFLGIDICALDGRGQPDPARASAIINALRQRGVLIGAAGKFGHTLKVRPPLCVTQADIDFFLEHFDQALLATRRKT
ncbi:aspartate aminotransferase family protein [Marinobacter lutaoensis]|jgi:4-aminobutyrate aminotransferase-like enzyme|uniref:aspartate aminotransferase family protein n=1 Tax=Marinobacter lutaoensis TaxID=135739 RepID=UPI000C0A8A2D|nr:aspartate aminotransferase family protein [Marinobacter lutaoensis]MBE02466.1 aspartate aminotransferase family protein [Marinobacter sp.]MBI43890.1 aspartate aminotransferase family protein [Oceanospirillales bacterium]NVD35961.1 aspartate aminotransferase family protein [Marinobacter lutaoensis]|tara:strand:+ start:4844 stop:6211 length:1368 start_codon:yes stop_codon:yes gene_type:complete